jgi:uncharacterized tellurite resistance protein B-like protein
MSILNKVLGIAGGSSFPTREAGETATVRKIVAELEALPPQQARYLATFAAILARVAHADLAVSQEETARMEALLQELGGLSEGQAALVVHIAKQQNVLFGGTENFLLTREFRALATPTQVEQLLHCSFAVAAADGSIAVVEEERIRQIATELGVSHREYIDIRSRYSAQREVMQRLRAQQPSGR